MILCYYVFSQATNTKRIVATVRLLILKCLRTTELAVSEGHYTHTADGIATHRPSYT